MFILRIQDLRPRAARLAEAFGRLLYPPHCAVCRRPLDEHEDRYLCRECIAAIEFVCEPACRKCGHELGPYTAEGARCAHCRNTPLRFDRAVAAAHHTGPARDLVLAFKFAAQKQNAYPLSKLLAARLGDSGLLDRVEFIVPVPLHTSRLRERGFNQSELLAHELGDQLGLRVVTGNLRRVVNTRPQTRQMSSATRRANVKGAFAVKSSAAFAGKSLLLVDDVLTTGATAGECARSLYRAGAAAVGVLTVARAL